jgi:hypothetical protein
VILLQNALAIAMPLFMGWCKAAQREFHPDGADFWIVLIGLGFLSFFAAIASLSPMKIGI